MSWTEEKCERLKELRAAGTSFSICAEEIGCSRNAAIGKARRLSLGPFAREVDPGLRRPRIVRPRVSKPRALPPSPLITKGEVSLLALESYHCRYPFDGGLFCGRQKSRGAYCEYHGGLCYLSSGWKYEDNN